MRRPRRRLFWGGMTRQQASVTPFRPATRRSSGQGNTILSGHDSRVGPSNCWACLLEGSMQRHVACFAGLLLLGAGTPGTRVFGAEPAWRYVARPRADAAPRPVFRFVALSGTRPDGLREEVTYRGREQKYARVRYG